MRDLRPELLPPKFDEHTVHRLTALADEIINLIDTGRDPNSAIEDFNREVPQPVSASDFHGAAGSMDTEEFVRRVMTPAPNRIPDITRDELLEIITLIMNDDDTTEHELQFWLDLLQANVPHPAVSDLIYYNDDPELTPTKVLDAALVYCP